MFVHFGLIHLGFNMWCLWNLGRAAEPLLGRFSYLLAYLVSGMFGSIASVYWHPLAAGLELPAPSSGSPACSFLSSI